MTVLALGSHMALPSHDAVASAGLSASPGFDSPSEIRRQRERPAHSVSTSTQ